MDKKSKDGPAPEMEVEQLHSTVRDIASLLALGFGRAGWRIIRNALKGNGTECMQGVYMQGVYMFAQIRNFDALTKNFQENILSFVNSMASIVHTATSDHHGATNKNIGDSWLSVWNFPSKVTIDSRLVRTAELESMPMDSKMPSEIIHLCDQSFTCAIKIILGILKSEEIAQYYEKEEVVAAIGNPTSKMVIGLHVGWAIEGAVGSQHKIDATYLSPNVNISARLETATAQYCVPILLSGQYVCRLSPSAQRLCRIIDVVQVKGSKKKIELFTIDIPMDLEDHRKLLKTFQPNKKKQLSQLDRIYKWRHSFISSYQQFIEDEDLQLVSAYQNKLKPFLDEWSEAFSLYRRGDWSLAKKWLIKALDIKGDDGPCKVLLSVIEEHNEVPPATFVNMGRSLNKK